VSEDEVIYPENLYGYGRAGEKVIKALFGEFHL